MGYSTYKPAKPLRSSSQCMLVVQKIRTEGYGNFYFYAAPTLWNYLHSTYLKKADTVSAFQD